MKRTRRISVLLGGITFQALGPLVATAHWPLSTASIRVSRGDPFAACSIGRYRNLAGDRSTPRTAVEPALAVDPATPGHWIGVWQQDRWADRDGGARGLVAAYTFDSGKTWKEVPLPFDRCMAGGLPYDRGSDPSISIGPDGIAYFAGVAYTAVRHPTHRLTELESSTMAVASSRDGGRSWRRPMPIGADYRRSSANDKGWVTADPRKPGTAYLVWDRYDLSGRGGIVRFSKTTNGGRTWSRPRTILKQTKQASDFNQILVDHRTGRLYDVYEDEPLTKHAPPSVIDVCSSSDGGVSWSRPRRVAPLQLPGLHVPGTRLRVRGGDGMQAAVDPLQGTLYVVWERKTNGVPRIAFASSRDGGDYWSVRRRIGPPSRGAEFLPNVAVGAAGEVAVSFYAFRRSHPGMTDYRVMVSRNAGSSFGAGRRFDSFDIRSAPRTDGEYFLGDYEGLASDGQEFIGFWSRSVAGRTSVREAVLAR